MIVCGKRANSAFTAHDSVSLSRVGSARQRRRAGTRATPRRRGACAAAGGGPYAISSGSGAGFCSPGVRPRSGTSLMNSASTKTSSRAGTPQMNTPCTRVGDREEHVCSRTAGSESTVAGSSWPPLALMCAPARRGGQRLGQPAGRRCAPNAATPERAADLLEEHPGAAGHAHVPLLHAVLRDQRDHLHQEAHAEAEDDEVRAPRSCRVVWTPVRSAGTCRPP